MTSTTSVPAVSNTTAHLQHVYAVYVCWEGESGCDMLTLGLYANELHARRVAKDYHLAEGETVEVTIEPILDAPETRGDYIDDRGGDSCVGHVYSREA